MEINWIRYTYFSHAKAAYQQDQSLLRYFFELKADVCILHSNSTARN